MISPRLDHHRFNEPTGQPSATGGRGFTLIEILVVMTLLGLLFVNLDAGQLGSLAGMASLAVTILQLVAIVLLFRADARAWLSDDADDAEAP